MGRTTFRLSAALLAATLFCSCSNDASNIVGTESGSSKPAATTPAHPALAYIGWQPATRNSGQGYYTIAVMDTDGTHRTNVYTGPTTWLELKLACWSPSGGSIAWVEGARTIKAIDVSVNSSGVPVGSNARTICSFPDTITGLAWCSMASTGRLAFTSQTTINGSPSAALYTISQNGGTPTLIKTIPDGYMKSLTWSPDDSRIAVFANAYRYAANQYFNWHLQVVNSGNGTLLEDDPLPTFAAVTECEWARTGNTIAFSGGEPNMGSRVYYLDYGTLAGPYSQGISGRCPTWSPNNTELMFEAPNATTNWTVNKITAFGSTASVVIDPDPIAYVGIRWKR